MPGSPQFTSPPWNESDAIRETALLYVDDPDDRETLRRLGRLIFNLAVETTREMGGDPSVTRAELRAAQADLRFVAGYLASIGREAEESSLSTHDAILSRFAGRLAVQVASLDAAIDRRLA
jgi:hypothetical protein